MPRSFHICVALVTCLVPARRVSGAEVSDKPAGQVYKNLQLFPEMHSTDVIRTMHLIRASLGVRCDFCHDVDKYESDAKPSKGIARKMIKMVTELNKSAFEGRPVVTCNTCHRGAVTPMAVPAIGQAQFTDTTRTDVAVPLEQVTAVEVLDRYLEAVGGRGRLEALKNRTAEGTLSHSKIVTTPGSPARVVNRGQQDRVTLKASGSDRLVITIGAGPDAVRHSIENGSGTAKTPAGERKMTAAEIQGLAAKLGMQRELKLRERAQSMVVLGTSDIDGKGMRVLEARTDDGRSEQLYFGIDNGLLRRRIVLSPTPVGSEPEQIDFGDYRKIDGIRVPLVIKTSFLDDNHFGTTLRFKTVRHNFP